MPIPFNLAIALLGIHPSDVLTHGRDDEGKMLPTATLLVMAKYTMKSFSPTPGPSINNSSLQSVMFPVISSETCHAFASKYRDFPFILADSRPYTQVCIVLFPCTFIS